MAITGTQAQTPRGRKRLVAMATAVTEVTHTPRDTGASLAGDETTTGTARDQSAAAWFTVVAMATKCTKTKSEEREEVEYHTAQLRYHREARHWSRRQTLELLFDILDGVILASRGRDSKALDIICIKTH